MLLALFLQQVLIRNYGFVADQSPDNLPPATPVFTLEYSTDTPPVGDNRTTLSVVAIKGQLPSPVVQTFLRLMRQSVRR